MDYLVINKTQKSRRNKADEGWCLHDTFSLGHTGVDFLMPFRHLN